MYVVITGVFAIFGSLFCLFVCVRAGVGGRRFGGGGSADERGDLGAARKCKEEEVEALKEVTFKAGDEEEGREEGGTSPHAGPAPAGARVGGAVRGRAGGGGDEDDER